MCPPSSIFSAPARRQRCAHCQRPLSHCLCASIPSIANRPRVLVLQHPEEARHPLNTARLAVLGLQQAELWVGEEFPALEPLLSDDSQVYLLFPEDQGPKAISSQGLNRGSQFEPSHVKSGLRSGAAEQREQPVGAGAGASVEPTGSKQLLIVPDGTWRQARRIVQANPVLHALPRLSLPAGLPSQYRVRKARETGAVATIEAIVQALAQLEPEQDFQPLLEPFHLMVEQQIAAMGPETYWRNHGQGCSKLV